MNRVRPVVSPLQNVEDALYKTGWGLYYKFLVGFAAATTFTNGFVLLCVHLAVPLSACDTLLEKTDIRTIFICFSGGRALGGFLLSNLSDSCGKRCMITKTFIIGFCSCFISAFSHNVYTLYIAATLLGSAVEANITAMKIHLSEILPIYRRGLYIVLPDVFWTIGYFSTSVFLYLLGTASASQIQHHITDMRLTCWRVVFAVGGGLCITLACSSALLELSPRYLLFKKRIIGASLLLKQFYAINRSKYSETFEVQSQQLVDLVHDYGIEIDHDAVGIFQNAAAITRILTTTIKVLMSKKFYKLTLMLTLIKLPMLFGIAGTNIFLTRHLDLGRNVTGSDFVHLTMIYPGNCTVTFEETEFRNFLLLSTNTLFGQIILLCVIDRTGRRFPMVAGLLLCSLTSAVLIFDINFTVAAVASSLLTFGYGIVTSSLQVTTIESFPTAVRGTATGFTSFYAVLTSCFLYGLLESKKGKFLTAMTAASLAAAATAWFVPETKGKPMVE